MANLAASGGYWVSTPATRVFAEPATITGSIGIFAIVPTFEKALGDYGVSSDGVHTTPLSGQPDLAGGLSPEVSAMIQANIENGYARFLALVGKARGRTPEQIDAIAQGRVWDGGTARQNGLVDQFGGLDEALAYAAQQAHLDKGKWHAEFLGGDGDPYASLIERLRGDDDSPPSSASADWAAMATQRQLDIVGQALTDAERIFSARGAQVYCLECPLPVVHRPTSNSGSSLMARLAHAVGLF
jgi:protease-4